MKKFLGPHKHKEDTIDEVRSIFIFVTKFLLDDKELSILQ